MIIQRLITTVLMAATAAMAGLISAQDNPDSIPRLANGKPDLQGMWTNNTITPLTRPEHFGNKLVLSREEAFQLEQEVAAFTEEQDQPSDPNREAPTKGQIELADSYNNFWFDDGTKVAEYNGEYRSSLIVDPANGQYPDYTPAAAARIEAASIARAARGNFDGPEMRPLGERCLMAFGSSAGPPMLPILYNNHYQIVQTPDYLMILVEMVHDVRIIRIDDDPLPDAMKRWMGDSVAHWEGDTLVIETRNFNPNQRFRNSSDNVLITERLTRVSDNRINYSFTVNDPDTYVQPFSAEIPMNWTDDKMYEYACHEGNYSLPGILAGARLDEREAAQN